MSQAMRQTSIFPLIKEIGSVYTRCTSRGCVKAVKRDHVSGVCDECRTLTCSCGSTWVHRFAVDESVKKSKRLKCKDCTRAIKGIVNRTGAEGI